MKKVITSIREFIKIHSAPFSGILDKLSPYQNLAYKVFLYTGIGFVILSLPFMTKTSVPLLDRLFTAASAVSTAGLHTVNFADTYTFWGKLAVIILIQICGIGYMTMTSFIHISVSDRMATRHKEVLNAEFALPRSIRLKDFLRAVFIFTAIAEITGAVILLIYFMGQGYGFWRALWFGAFHSISAFCTAGFTLFSNGLEGFSGTKLLPGVVSVLSIFGAMGFIVVIDVYNRITGKVKTISFTTKTIVVCTLLILAFGTAAVLASSPLMKGGVWAAFFHTMSAMTTSGFNTIAASTLSISSLFILIAVMCIGASPSGTGGGIKTTTVTAVLAIVYNRLINHDKVVFFGREIPLDRLYMAVATFSFYVIVLFFALFALTCTEDFLFIEMFFETASALGTVGLTAGITPKLSAAGKIIIMLTMLIGRIGVITFGMALTHKDEDEAAHKKADLAV